MNYKPNLHELHHIIADRRLNSVFQPVVDLRAERLFGYEALIRGPADSALHSPAALFDCADREGLTFVLESACWESACRSFCEAGPEGKLFINVSPVSLADPNYREAMISQVLTPLGLPPERIVIEITEQHPLDDYRAIGVATRHFKELGMEIAIDDLGAGYAGLRTWAELRPHYVKIDRHFIENIHQDPIKREFVRSIRRIAHELNCRVIAEGIESAAELAAIHALDIDFGQGFHLGRPAAVPEAEHVVLARVEQRADRQHPRGRSSQTVGEMMIPMPTVNGDTLLDETVDLFHGDRQLSTLPVLDGGRVIGVVKRQDVLELMAARYTRELHGRKPISQFMDASPVCIEHDQTLEAASRRLTSDANSDLIQDFIILQDGSYLGVGKTNTLLRRITEQQIHFARYANPLTLLPGNPPLHEHLNDALGQHADIHVAYVDLNDFKPYNDYYGYDAGDRILVILSRILRDAADPDCDFLGHIGGDDFILVFRSPDWQARCERVLARFAAEAPAFYDQAALARGGIEGHNRRSEPEFFPLISVAVGVVHPDPVHCVSSHDVALLAAEAKQQAKAQSGNALFVSRRRRPNSVTFAGDQASAG